MTPNRKLSNAQEVLLCKMYSAGEDIQYLEEYFNIKSRHLYKVLERNGVPRNRQNHRRITPEDKPIVIESFLNGLSTKEICSKFGLCVGAVQKINFENSVRPRYAHYLLDESVFDEINEFSAYWAGFLMADGCICRNSRTKKNSRIALYLQERDVGHIKKFLNFLKTNIPIKAKAKSEKNSLVKKSGTVFGVQITSQKLANKLVDFGVVPRKSLTARVNSTLGDNRDFWRGVVDGDGTVSYYNSSGNKYPYLALSSASSELIQQFSDFIEENVTYAPCHIETRKIEGYNDIYTIRLTCKSGVAAVKFLYDGCSISLDRKKVVADEILSTPYNKYNIKGLVGCL